MTPQIRGSSSRKARNSIGKSGAGDLTMAKISTIRRFGVRLAQAVAVSCAVALAGCSGDDVAFEGKIFDAVGMNQKTSKAEPKMVDRAPLVMPPNPSRVPEPGLPPEGQSADVAALADPDVQAKVSKSDLERQQAEYCKKNYELPKAHGDETTAELAVGPLGSCRPSALTAFQKWNSGEEEGTDGQVEQ